MNILQVVSQALGIYLAQSVSFKVANKWQVTVSDEAGNAKHLNLSEAMAVLYLVINANAPGSFQSGVIKVDVKPL